MTFNIIPAKRKSVPMLISLAGVSGVGQERTPAPPARRRARRRPDGKVGFLDTENGRGSMYADSPGIMAALPDGYEIAEMREPFGPSRYSEAVEAFEKHGCKVLVIDSMTHEWEGYGGCSDIAENNKLRGMPNWAKAKMEHKRMMNHLLASPDAHLIFLHPRAGEDRQGHRQGHAGRARSSSCRRASSRCRRRTSPSR